MNAVPVSFVDNHGPIPIGRISADDPGRDGSHGCGFLIGQQLLELGGNNGLFPKKILFTLQALNLLPEVSIFFPHIDATA